MRSFAKYISGSPTNIACGTAGRVGRRAGVQTGAAGAVAFDGKIPDTLGAGQSGPGFPIEVFNVPGAEDGFFFGQMNGWPDGADWPTALKYANARSAFAVSRHG